MEPIYSGKVRDIYDAGEDRLLMVTSDRVSAFDVVFDETVPQKGRVLTGLTSFWLDKVADIVPGHLISTDVSDFPAFAKEIPDVEGRTMLVRKAEMLKIECIVRGYISGSAWKEYQNSGTMNGQPLPGDLVEAQKLPEPVFTPSTKADIGEHDENISFEAACDIVGKDVAEKARQISIDVYNRGAEWAASRGIIIADTKFELGYIDGELCLCDEVLTPDSSRFWPADQYKPGTMPPSFDKQPIRDWSEATGWNKKAPAPHIPEEVVKASTDRYVTAYEQITGQSLSSWHGHR